jgi:hypothetical protein
MSLFQASQTASMIWSKVSKTRLESQLARRYCQMFSAGLSSGAREGSQIGVMFLRHNEIGRSVPAGAVEDQDGVRAEGDGAADFFEMKLHASVSAKGNASAAPVPRAGQMAPNRLALS